MGKEIERKFLIKELPANLEEYKYHELEQGYLNTAPVVRVRKEDDDYYLTYKGKGFIEREEYNLPLTEEAYLHLVEKADGKIISKRRYLIPFGVLQLNWMFSMSRFKPFILAEVEFPSFEEAERFTFRRTGSERTSPVIIIIQILIYQRVCKSFRAVARKPYLRI